MILWVKGNSVAMPVNQRVKVLLAEFNRVIVELCGTGDVKSIAPDDIIGVDVSEQLSIRFKEPVFHAQNSGDNRPL